MDAPPERSPAAPPAHPGVAPPTWATWREARAILAYPPHLRRTVTIALVVGTILFCINQLDVVLRGEADAIVWIKSAVTYIVPFCVSSAGVLAGTRRPPVEAGSADSRHREGDAWSDYLAIFHRERPGITEAILTRARAEDGRDPYDWVAEALPGDGLVVDAACGSGPLAARVFGDWVGLDRSQAEVGLAAAVAPGQVVLADAARIPVRRQSADSVVAAMALMVVDDPDTAVAEMARLLRPGGRLVALVPATAPLTTRDRARYLRLLAALRLRHLPFRHPGVLHDPQRPLARAGLTVASDERRRFAYPLIEPEDALRWVRSLYLPIVSPRRLRAAQRVTRRWAGSSIGMPLRRVVATRTR
ncbi:MAG: nitrate/nitrite transporter NrtS [Acidimicrobiales bacterium]